MMYNNNNNNNNNNKNNNNKKLFEWNKVCIRESIFKKNKIVQNICE